MAETARFELAVRFTPYDGLANRWFQPLTHVSALFGGDAGYSERFASNQLHQWKKLL
jgi:hypothetical protein